MSVNLKEILEAYEQADCLYTEAEVEQAIDAMAKAITERLAFANPLVFCVMNGGMVVSGKLLTKLRFPLEAGYLHATRYGHETCGTLLDWKVRPAQDLVGRTVLIIDDIIDEGVTLAAIIDYCYEEGAQEVLTAVLVNKDHDHKARVGLTGDFVGMTVEDRFLFGYGMDYKGYWRNAAGIYALKGY
jgi:hypoxanthine phosphoribosyltransferase